MKNQNQRQGPPAPQEPRRDQVSPFTRDDKPVYTLPANRNSYGDELTAPVAYLRSVLIYLCVAALAILVIVFAVHHAVNHFSNDVETMPATLTTVVVSAETEMYVFRDETVLRAQAGLSSVPAVREGSHIAAGVTAARMYDSSSPDVVAQLEVLDAQLETLQAMRDSTLSIRDIVAIDNNIYDIMHSVADAGRSGDCSAVSSLRGKLISALNRRSVVMGSFSDVESAITELTARRERIVNALGVCRQTVYAQKSGYYYAEADGYESTFTANAALTMTPETFASMIETEPQSLNGTAGKIAGNYLWYTACFLPAEDARPLAEGKVYTVTFTYNYNKKLTLTLVRKEEYRDAGEEKVMLVFSCGMLPDGFLFARSQPAVIALREYTGFRVPVSALRVQQERDTVFVLVGSKVRVRYVQEIFREEGYVLLADYQASGVAGVDYEVKESEDEEEFPDPDNPNRWLRRNDIIIVSGRELTNKKLLS